MKKFLVVLLCLAMTLSLAACGGSSQTQTPSQPQQNETQTQPEEQPADTPEEQPEETPEDQPSSSDALMGAALADFFTANAADFADAAAAIEAIQGSGLLEMECMTAEFGSSDFLNGFTDIPAGFTKASGLFPMIGSIPFVCYVLETEDAEALKAELLDKADPRWNICTQAEETVCESYENLVFFAMCPGADF